MTERALHIHLEIPQDVADQLTEGEEFTCRVVRDDDGTLVLCIDETSPENADG